MQIEQLETFLDLVESRNFNRTAERLRISQSTVSARMRALEAEIGCPLFTRGRGGAEATAAGLQLVAHARSIRATWTLARQDAAIVDRFDGLIRIAAQVSLVDPLLVSWIEWLRAEAPRCSIHAEADYSMQMVMDLSNGTLDIGVVYTPRYLPELVYETLAVEPMELVSNYTERLADVTPDTYIRVGYSPGFDRTHAELLPALSRSGLSVGLASMALPYLKVERHAAYVPRWVSGPLIVAGTVTKVADAPTIEQHIFSGVHTRRRHLPLIRTALRGLQRLAAETTGLAAATRPSL